MLRLFRLFRLFVSTYLTFCHDIFSPHRRPRNATATLRSVDAFERIVPVYLNRLCGLSRRSGPASHRIQANVSLHAPLSANGQGPHGCSVPAYVEGGSLPLTRRSI